ncbi:sugar kinase [Prochlorococcus sp. MIT 1300]|uniref:FGGY-family carbohydrate kinase n=1 Tax=Prochlorococcus sp. MIT 1300 TaxID=3096218 RepID=UPI002A7576C3|nr:sugar kinase [Prochlorococcus sp. MIT 1300]
MGQSHFVLGIDLGTSGVRFAVLETQTRKLICNLETSYPNSIEEVKDWESSCEELICQLPQSIRSNLKAIAIDGTSGTLAAINSEGFPFGPALPYNLSCPEYAFFLRKLVPQGGIATSTSSSLARALRLSEQYGNEILLRHQADWLTGWFLGNWCWGEEGNNLRLGWDLKTHQWPKTFQQLPWYKALPAIKPSGKILGQISKQKAQKNNLPEELLIVSGTTDSNAAVVASNPTQEDGVTVLGSTLVVKQFVQLPLKGQGVTNHRVGGRWLIGGASNSGGAVLRKIFSDNDLKELSRQINPDTKSGLNFLPLICKGERFPTEDPNLEPIMEPRPISDSLYLHGLLEGIAEIELNSWRKLIDLGAPAPKRIITIGGGAKNPQWRKIRERLLGVPVRSCFMPPAVGVANIALQAILAT